MGQHRRSLDVIDVLVAELGPGPWPSTEVVASGVSHQQVKRAVQAGRLLRPHRGVLALPVGHPARLRHTELRAALLTGPEGAVGSHHTGAEVHVLWTPSRPDDHVHVIVPGDQDEIRHGVHMHGSPLPPELITSVDGLPVTTIARTAVDVARGRRLPDALVVLDSAVRMIADPRASTSTFRRPEARAAALRIAWPMLKAAYDSVWSWQGSVVVRDALPMLDPGSESPFESSSRGWMILDGLPVPRIGFPVRGASGRLWWTDFAWPDLGVIGEADGYGKYGDDDQSVRRALAAEKERHDDLADAGWIVVRWHTRERPSIWLARVRATLERGHTQAVGQFRPRIRPIAWV